MVSSVHVLDIDGCALNLFRAPLNVFLDVVAPLLMQVSQVRRQGHWWMPPGWAPSIWRVSKAVVVVSIGWCV